VSLLAPLDPHSSPTSQVHFEGCKSIFTTFSKKGRINLKIEKEREKINPRLELMQENEWLMFMEP
jgi:hypothetical protein